MVAKTPDEMTLPHLRAYLKKVKANTPAYFSALLQYHKKFSIAFACLAMGLLALPLGIQGRHSKKAVGVGFGLVFFLLYYILLSVGSTLGENGRYPPLLAMWMPNVILGGLGIYLLLRSAKEKPIIIYGLLALFAKATRRGRKK
jgi:lipopolysaccharide export system permease protein